MPNYNMPRYDMPRNMTGEMDRFMRDRDDSCECDAFPAGMAYVPWHNFENIHEPERALNAGTIFMELEKPFTGRRAFRK